MKASKCFPDPFSKANGLKMSLATSLQLDYGSLITRKKGFRCQTFVPTGLLMVAASIMNADPSVRPRIVELNSGINAGKFKSGRRFHEAMAEEILLENPDVVGMTTDADSYHHTVLTAEALKKISPRTKVLLGGPQATTTAEATVRTYPFVDMVLRGEAELSAPALVEALSGRRDFKAVPGLTYRSKDSIISNPSPALVSDLDTLSLPAYEVFHFEGHEAVYVEVGRGCPFKCSFCSTAPFWQHRFRVKSSQRIIEEIRLVKRLYGVTRFNFIHDIFTFDHKWVYRFIDELKKARLGITWTCSSRTDTITGEMIDEMAAAGAVSIYYGVESGSNEVQKKTKKGLDLGKAKKIIRKTIETRKCVPIAGLIIGFPYDSESTIGDTLDVLFDLLEMGIGSCHLFALCPFAGSALFEEYKEKIVFNRNFIDLPASAAARRPVEEMMRDLPELFSRYYYYPIEASDPSLAAYTDEFSTHISALRPLALAFRRQYRSSYVFYANWSSWLKRKRRNRRFLYSSIDDFIKFLSEELLRKKVAGEGLRELVMYEKIKREMELKVSSFGDNGPVQDGFFVHAPLTKMVSFPKDPIPLLTSPELKRFPEEARKGADIIFYRHTSGRLKTIKVNGLAYDIFKLTERPVSFNEMESMKTSDFSGKGREVLEWFVAEGIVTGPEEFKFSIRGGFFHANGLI